MYSMMQEGHRSFHCLNMSEVLHIYRLYRQGLDQPYNPRSSHSYFHTSRRYKSRYRTCLLYQVNYQSCLLHRKGPDRQLYREINCFNVIIRKFPWLIFARHCRYDEYDQINIFFIYLYFLLFNPGIICFLTSPCSDLNYI